MVIFPGSWINSMLDMFFFQMSRCDFFPECIQEDWGHPSDEIFTTWFRKSSVQVVSLVQASNQPPILLKLQAALHIHVGPCRLGGGNSNIFGIFTPNPGYSWSNLTVCIYFSNGFETKPPTSRDWRLSLSIQGLGRASNTHSPWVLIL